MKIKKKIQEFNTRDQRIRRNFQLETHAKKKKKKNDTLSCSEPLLTAAITQKLTV